MSQICKKDNCQRVSIPRGKYCMIHRTGKKIPIKNDIPIVESKINEEKLLKEKQYEEERILIQEQEEEYKKTIELDKERIRLDNEKKEIERFEEELAYVMKMSEKLEIENKKKLLENQNIDENDLSNYHIKFKLKDFTFLKKFNKNLTINDLKNYVDICIYDNKIPITNYNLVKNFPKEILDNLNLKLSESNLTKNCILYIENLD